MSATVETETPQSVAHRSAWPWLVAATAFVALVGAGSFRAAPSVLIQPLQADFGWSRGTISVAVMVNLILYGLTSPFAAALMDRFGMRAVVASALTLISIGSGLTLFITESWQLILCWGVLVGLGAGSMALAFVATVTNRWFVKRKGLVTGVLTAGGAAGQLVFLPILAWLADHRSWQSVSITVSIAALTVVPVVLLFLRNRPQDVGTVAYGAGEPGYPAPPPAPAPGEARGAATRAVRLLREASHTKVFWLLAGTFAICGASTNGLIGTHFIPAAHDHGMAETAAAGLLALVGIFDIAGTIGSGWLTDRVDPRLLLLVYYVLRGISLMALPLVLGPSVHPTLLLFVVFYGLDWVATIPPTMALVREHYGARAPVVFGWVFASHQVGAAVMALVAGIIRDRLHTYDAAWYVGGALCLVAGALSLAVGRARTSRKAGLPA